MVGSWGECRSLLSYDKYSLQQRIFIHHSPLSLISGMVKNICDIPCVSQGTAIIRGRLSHQKHVGLTRCHCK